MNKFDFISVLAEKHGMTKAEADRVIDTVVDAISGALIAGDKVALSGLGTFSVVERNARVGRNPKTGETLEIPAKKAVKFKVGSKLSGAVK